MQEKSLEVPHSLESEKMVIGGIALGGNDVYAKIETEIKPDDFYNMNCRLLFKVVTWMAAKDIPIDCLTINQALHEKGGHESMRLITYLNEEILRLCTGYSTILHHASAIREKSLVRSVMQTATKMLEDAKNLGSKSAEELVSAAEDAIFTISGTYQKRGLSPSMKEMLTVTTEDCQRIFENPGKLQGLSTGFTEVDKMLGGMRPGQMIVIGACPSMGKTTFATNIAQYVALDSKRPVHIFSMEMSVTQMMKRIISSLSHIEHEILDATGKMSDSDYARYASTLSILLDTTMSINDDSALTPSEIRGISKRFAQKHKDIGLIVVDYIGLMNMPDQKGNRVNEISEASKALKALAKDLKCPIIVLSQLNRNLSTRQDKRPIMSDLRDSGAVEQDADVIAFLYRDEVYNKDSEDKGIAEIIIAKNRSGRTGTVRLRYTASLCKFEDLTLNINGGYHAYK